MKKGEFLYPSIFKEIINIDTKEIYYEEKFVNSEKNKEYKVNIESLIIILNIIII